MPAEPSQTKSVNFRLAPETIDDLDFIAKQLSEQSGLAANRTDAVRYAARQAAVALRKKSSK